MSNPEKLSTWVKTMNKKYIKMITENFKAICVFERKLQQNLSRDDLCIIKKKTWQGCRMNANSTIHQ